MSKLFSIREELMNDKEQREKLRKYLEKGGKISNFGVVVKFEGENLIYAPPFCKKGFIYDTKEAQNFSERKLETAVSLLLMYEGEKGSFFTSESVLLQHLKIVDVN